MELNLTNGYSINYPAHSGFLLMRNFKCPNKPFHAVFIKQISEKFNFKGDFLRKNE
jgi:hypothetical protein